MEKGKSFAGGGGNCGLILVSDLYAENIFKLFNVSGLVSFKGSYYVPVVDWILAVGEGHVAI